MGTKLNNNGLSKLVEELGELSQVAGKLLQFPELQENIHKGLPAWHCDGTDIRERLIDEVGDVLASISYVVERLKIDAEAVIKRADEKKARFEKWDT